MSESPASVLAEHASDPRVQRAGRWGGAILFLVLLFVPGLDLDPPQRRVAATTALVATLWLTQGIPLGAASLLPAALLPLLGVVSAEDAARVYLSDIVMLFFAAFLVAAGLERWGVHRRMALALVDVVGTDPRRVVLGFMAATAFVSLWINNTAATLMMYPIGLAVIATTSDAAGTSKRTGPDPFATALLLGIAYAASIGGIATKVGTAPNQILFGVMRGTFEGAPEPSFGAWMLVWTPFAAVYVLGTWWILTRLGQRLPEGTRGGGETVRAERARLGPMSRGEKLMAAVFVGTALLWITRERLDLGVFVFPGWAGALQDLQAHGDVVPGAFKGYVSDATVALAVACACFFIPVDRAKGTYLLDWSSVSTMPWDVLLLFGGGFCIAAGFHASGLDGVLGESLAPWIQGLPDLLVVALVAAFMTLFSEIASNTVLTNLMLPVLASTAVRSGIDPRVVMIPATVAASCGFMLPIATPPNAIAFASRRIRMDTMARLGLLVDVLGVVLIALVFHFVGRAVFGIGAEVPDWAAR
jgi:solute carrier family 13 (sodium-dependent dicarboxylate transporter), member 2/3/5